MTVAKFILTPDQIKKVIDIAVKDTDESLELPASVVKQIYVKFLKDRPVMRFYTGNLVNQNQLNAQSVFVQPGAKGPAVIVLTEDQFKSALVEFETAQDTTVDEFMEEFLTHQIVNATTPQEIAHEPEEEINL